MSETILDFFKKEPFWAIFIAVFMILPMIGAVLHIVLKALGKRGIDNSPPSWNLPPPENEKSHKSGSNQ